MCLTSVGTPLVTTVGKMMDDPPSTLSPSGAKLLKWCRYPAALALEELAEVCCWVVVVEETALVAAAAADWGPYWMAACWP